jgi:hypothetical protein
MSSGVQFYTACPSDMEFQFADLLYKIDLLHQQCDVLKVKLTEKSETCDIYNKMKNFVLPLESHLTSVISQYDQICPLHVVQSREDARENAQEKYVAGSIVNIPHELYTISDNTVYKKNELKGIQWKRKLFLQDRQQTELQLFSQKSFKRSFTPHRSTEYLQKMKKRHELTQRVQHEIHCNEVNLLQPMVQSSQSEEHLITQKPISLAQPLSPKTIACKIIPESRNTGFGTTTSSSFGSTIPGAFSSPSFSAFGCAPFNSTTPNPFDKSYFLGISSTAGKESPQLQPTVVSFGSVQTTSVGAKRKKESSNKN